MTRAIYSFQIRRPTWQKRQSQSENTLHQRVSNRILGYGNEMADWDFSTLIGPRERAGLSRCFRWWAQQETGKGLGSWGWCVGRCVKQKKGRLKWARFCWVWMRVVAGAWQGFWEHENMRVRGSDGEDLMRRVRGWRKLLFMPSDSKRRQKDETSRKDWKYF